VRAIRTHARWVDPMQAYRPLSVDFVHLHSGWIARWGLYWGVWTLMPGECFPRKRMQLFTKGMYSIVVYEETQGTHTFHTRPILTCTFPRLIRAH
jgi:hypothetical protein